MMLIHIHVHVHVHCISHYIIMYIAMMKSNLRERKNSTRSRAMAVVTWKFARPRGSTSPPPGVHLASQRRTIHFKSWQVVGHVRTCTWDILAAGKVLLMYSARTCIKLFCCASLLP